MKSARHRASTIIELLMVITITTVLMGVCIQTLVAILPVVESAKDQVGQSGLLMSLGERFRRDAHEATQLTAADCAEIPKSKLQSEWYFKNSSGQTIHYRLDADKLVRDAFMGDAQRQHETYALPDAAVTGLELDELGGKRLAALIVKPQGSRPVHIEALVGSQVFEPKK